MSSVLHPPPPILVGDIGGSNCRLAIWDGASGDFIDRVSCSTEAYSSATEAISAFLARGVARPHRASLALACPITDDQPKLTNTTWRFDRRELMAAFRWDNLLLVNDLVAQARAVRELGSSSFTPVGFSREFESLPKPAVIIGAGTGLGVALLEDHGASSSEGGHIGFSSSDDLEAELVKMWRPELGRVTNEHVISGPGIVRLYRALSAIAGKTSARIDAPEIVRRGVARECAVCVETCERFAMILGSVAGDLALLFCGGSVVFVGGITTAILPFVNSSSFRTRFEQKGPAGAFLAKAPTVVTTATDLGLHGARALMQDLSSFAQSGTPSWIN